MLQESWLDYRVSLKQRSEGCAARFRSQPKIAIRKHGNAKATSSLSIVLHRTRQRRPLTQMDPQTALQSLEQANTLSILHLSSPFLTGDDNTNKRTSDTSNCLINGRSRERHPGNPRGRSHPLPRPLLQTALLIRRASDERALSTRHHSRAAGVRGCE